MIIESLQDYITSLLNEDKTGNDNKSSIVQELMSMVILSFYSKEYDKKHPWLNTDVDKWDKEIFLQDEEGNFLFKDKEIQKIFNGLFSGNFEQCKKFLKNDQWRNSFKYQLKSFLMYLDDSTNIDINNYSFVHHDTGKSISISNREVGMDTSGICDFIKSYLTSLNNSDTVSFKKDEVQKADMYLIEKDKVSFYNTGGDYRDLQENFKNLFSSKKVIPISLKLLKKSDIGYKNIIPVITVDTSSVSPNSLTYNFNTNSVKLEKLTEFLDFISGIQVLEKDILLKYLLQDLKKNNDSIYSINDIEDFNIDDFLKKIKKDTLISEVSKLPLTFTITSETSIKFDEKRKSNIEYVLSIRSNSHGIKTLINGVESFGSCTVEIKPKNGGAQLGKVVKAIERKIKNSINTSISQVSLSDIHDSIISEKISKSFFDIYKSIKSNEDKLKDIYERMIDEKEFNTDIVIIYIIASLLKWKNTFDKFLVNLSNIAYIGYSNNYVDTYTLDDAIKVAFDSLIVYAYGGAEKSLPYLYLHK